MLLGLCLNSIKKQLMCLRHGSVRTSTVMTAIEFRGFPKCSHLLTNVPIFSSLNPLLLQPSPLQYHNGTTMSVSWVPKLGVSLGSPFQNHLCPAQQDVLCPAAEMHPQCIPTLGRHHLWAGRFVHLVIRLPLPSYNLTSMQQLHGSFKNRKLTPYLYPLKNSSHCPCNSNQTPHDGHWHPLQ